MDQPTVGRIVHYVNGTQRQHLAALVVAVPPHTPPETINLVVFTQDGNPQPRTYTRYSEEGLPFTWHWPEKV